MILNKKLPDVNTAHVFTLAVLLNVIFIIFYGYSLHGLNFDCTPVLGQVKVNCGLVEYTYKNFFIWNIYLLGIPMIVSGIFSYAFFALVKLFKK